VKALVLALDNTDPIDDGSVLYTCNVNIAQTAAPGTYALTNSLVGFSDSSGGAVLGTGTNGAVIVGGGGPTSTPTNTPTAGEATNTPTNTVVVPTNTPTLAPTNTPPTVVVPTNTPTLAATKTPTKTPSPIPPTGAPAPQEDDGGCQIGTASNGMSGWLLLIPVAGLVVVRRRQRR
jgi:MYXO-CTERM domain-containing protein